ncbi:MAG TPA: ribosomal protein S18-alanine N-acetyltransferase [Bryobacteraceae bacterium]|jgi:ribosomal-protein-alanine acetyltransferase|nr:ribosomal protein S18-alanine N-acetyltransferase [Bryobacteraceae bacterium]
MKTTEVVLRPAAPGDLPAIAAIQGSFGWPPEKYLEHDCRVALIDGRVCGFLVSRQTAPGEREILSLAVEPEMRRRGIAKKLMRDEISRFRGSWFLEVRESNAAAINLYWSMGFREVGRRGGYYSAPAESAIVMSFFS